MSHSITIRHNFETGHRLPFLGGKCQSLHGHSWWADVTITADRLVDGIALEYAEAKAWLRSWIDDNWDHGLILGADDPLANLLASQGKVYVMGVADANVSPARWPTVENVAMHLGLVVDHWCRQRNSLGHVPHIGCTRVVVSETHVNAATWDTTLPVWHFQDGHQAPARVEGA